MTHSRVGPDMTQSTATTGVTGVLEQSDPSGDIDGWIGADPNDSGHGGSTEDAVADGGAPKVSRPPRAARLLPGAVAAGIYLAISVAFWWGAWSTHPSTSTTCGCGDASRYLWFLEWPAYALTHGHNVLYSQWMFHPTGLNLLDDTSVLAFGIVLAPVTWLFGPIASLNTASTLIPVLSALSMFWLLRRWVSWAPAAFVGGLLFGFSPFILNGLVTGWLNIMLAVPPLIVGCLDELCVGRRRRRPGAVGAALGVLLAVQFFISTETLAITVVTAGIGMVVVGLYAAVFHFGELRRQARRIASGLGVAAGVAFALLAYPLWFALAGPAHLRGLVWPAITPGYYGAVLSEFFRLAGTAQATVAQRRYGGYQGTSLHQAEYVGVALAVVLIAGVLLWWRDRRLWLLAFLEVAAIALCLAPFTWANHFWVPWRILAHIPVVQNILPIRFAAMVYLAAAVMLGIIVDHTRTSSLQLIVRVRTAARGRSHSVPPIWPRLVAGVVALAVALTALVPIAATYAGNIPLTMEPVVLPEWFQTVGPHLPAGHVVLTYPAAFGGIQAPMAWQAVDKMSFALVGGDGPASVAQRAGAERPGFTVLADATFSLDPATAFLPSTVTKVHRAIAGWGTTLVVIPDQPNLPRYDQGNHTAYAVGLITLALGVGPQYRAQAWTWTVGPTISPSVQIDPTAFRLCVGTTNYRPGPPQTVPDCVLGRRG